MQQKKQGIIILLVFVFLGIILAVQFKTTLDINRQKIPAVKELEQLKNLLNEEKTTEDMLKASIDVNEKKKESYLKAVVERKDNDYLKRMMGERDDAKLKAGLTDVKGAGVIIKLDDAPVRKNENLLDIIIHDTDIMRVLNVLKKAGAQAISVNGERIIAMSEQVCAGPTIRINKKRYPVPYEIKAIGNPDEMEKHLKESEAIATMLNFRIRVEIMKSNEIFVPKYINAISGNTDKMISGLEVIEK